MASSSLLAISQLTKRYSSRAPLALDSVSLQVQAGEVYGFLGANGAGKSTAIRVILNFIQPTSGNVTIAGHDSVRQRTAAKRDLGYLSGDVALYGKATGKALLRYLAALQPLKHRTYLSTLIQRLDVPLNQPIDTLSKGNRQKLGLVQALMHEPSVLVMDEPTSGLDPLMQEVFFTLIKEAKTRGAAIFLSSHNLAEVQHICDRVGIIKHGKLIREQSITELRALDVPSYTVRLAHARDMPRLGKEKAVQLVSQTDSTSAVVRPAGSLSAALAALSRYNLRSLTSEHADLEDEFLKFYEDAV